MAKLVLILLFLGLATAPCYGGVLTKLGAATLVAEAVKDKLEAKSADTAVTSTATTDAKTLLSAPVIDINIKKEPLLTVTDAPCQNICKEKCTVTMAKQCQDVPIVTKECSPAKKTLVKKVCNKKCTLVSETPKYIKSIGKDTPQPEVPATPTATPQVDMPHTPETPETIETPAAPQPEDVDQPNPSKPPTDITEQPNPSTPPTDITEQPNPSKPPTDTTEQPNPSKPQLTSQSSQIHPGHPPLKQHFLQ